MDSSASELRLVKGTNKKRVLVSIMIGFLVLVFTLATFVFYKLYVTGNSIFSGKILDAVIKNQPLQTDKNGRANFLIIGTSEDDVGHSGAMLTDSIMVVSVDPATYKGNTISIPRDLWVQYEPGCILGNQGKINAVYFCAKNAGKSDDEAIKAMTRSVSTVTGLDIPYYAKINYAVIRDSVTALGKIKVNITSGDPRGIYDTNTNIKLPNGPSTIDGETALKLARARNSGAGYGLSRSNFDRELNQQLIAKAIFEKAHSSGVITNPVTLTQLIDSLSKNIVTNIPTNQLKSLKTVANNTQINNITTIDLAPKQEPLLITGSKNGQSIVTTTMSLFDYSLIQQAIATAIASTQPKTATTIL